MLLGLNGFSLASGLLLIGALIPWFLVYFEIRAKAVHAALALGFLFAFFYFKQGQSLVPAHASLDVIFQTQLPLGFSFVMFFALSFAFNSLLDRPAVPAGDREKVLAANSFFPTLIAGPFLRVDHAKSFGNLRPVVRDVTAGFILIFWGLAKKLIADHLGRSYIDQPHYFQLATSAEAWINLLVIPARFYCDFSGISHIAIGMARTFGTEIPENFNLPFISRSPSEYWQRWHISLGEWFRNYFYHPFIFKLWPLTERFLNPWVFNSFAILATMLVVGMWHGLHPHFFVWALYNGFWIIAFPVLMFPLRWTPRIKHWAGMIVTFYLLAIGMLILSYADTNGVLQRLADLHRDLFAEGPPTFDISAVAFCLLALVLPHCGDAIWMKYEEKICAHRWLYYPILILLFSIYLLFYNVSMPFIYSRF